MLRPETKSCRLQLCKAQSYQVRMRICRSRFKRRGLWFGLPSSFNTLNANPKNLISDLQTLNPNTLNPPQAIVSLVFAAYFAAINNGHGFLGQATL